MNDRKLKILFVASRLPSHLMTGDRLRSYYLIKGLVQRGHQVDLLAFENLTDSQVKTEIYSLCHTIRPIHYDDLEFQRQSQVKQLRDTFIGAWHGFPRRVWQFHSPAMINAFNEMVSQKRYDVIHFSEIGVTELIDTLEERTSSAKVLDFMDAVSMLVRRSLKYRRDISWPMRLIESYQLLRYEKALLGRVDAASVVSSRDQAYLNDPLHLQVIPIGIEVPDHIPETNKEFDLLFVGSMSTRANVDAVQWFVEFVWPQISARRPTTTLFIVGKDPLPSISRLANDRITVTGSVDDTSWYLSRARVFVAPIRLGAGQKIKLLEAFAHALPVVATHEASKGIDALDGQSIVLRDSPGEMAEAILGLLDDVQKRKKIGSNAFQFIRENFTWERSAELLESMYYQAMKKARIDFTTAN